MPSNRKIKIEDKITGTIIYASSLSEGSKLMQYDSHYLSAKIKKDEWQNNRFKWELIWR